MASQQGIAGWVFTHGEALVVNNVPNDERFDGEFDKASGFQTTGLVAVPLIVTGRKIGVLELLIKLNGESFSADNVNMLGVLAVQSAIAIENARLYQRLWAERNRILAIEEIESTLGKGTAVILAVLMHSTNPLLISDCQCARAWNFSSLFTG